MASLPAPHEPAQAQPGRLRSSRASTSIGSNQVQDLVTPRSRARLWTAASRVAARACSPTPNRVQVAAALVGRVWATCGERVELSTWAPRGVLSTRKPQRVIHSCARPAGSILASRSRAIYRSRRGGAGRARVDRVEIGRGGLTSRGAARHAGVQIAGLAGHAEQAHSSEPARPARAGVGSARRGDRRALARARAQLAGPRVASRFELGQLGRLRGRNAKGRGVPLDAEILRATRGAHDFPASCERIEPDPCTRVTRSRAGSRLRFGR